MNRKHMRGVYVVEFAIVGLMLFVLLFGVLEMGRLFFTVGTLNEVVRRGTRLAAVCDIHEPLILRRAIFNAATESGASNLINSLDTSDVTLVYLDANGAVVASPNDGGAGFSSIRYVQLSIVNFPFTLLIPGFGEGFTLPAFRATLPRESLGRHAEEGVVPEITPC
ncbi:TadE/TadG family type IV pilus assembly protein [Pseudomonas sp. N040]|uniref:TadE/TadG family type IV pilus assembly protein n=1 Tax=Pseudomonas sp. N040 TaxID=2785325 RepID=UPI0018A3330D|nr:TadE/TadG family type IV pilus assembly protein [Pseudomonas sp. N040]MBF7728646.1 pilus assembly protein [Pseudomonas sp. N040]MBW7012286.1 pilus assembly protein [Pseudomonas sp. N040]